MNKAQRTAIDNFAASLLGDDKAPVMVHAHNTLSNLGLDPQELEGALIDAAAKVTVKDKDGNKAQGEWNATKLRMIIVGATRPDALDIWNESVRLASDPTRTATAYHIAGNMAARALSDMELDLASLVRGAEGRFKATTEAAIAHAKAKGAVGAATKALAAWMSKAQATMPKGAEPEARAEIAEAFTQLNAVLEKHAPGESKD